MLQFVTYKVLLQVGKWLGVNNKAKETAFAAQINAQDGKDAARPQSICWNCGQSGHNFLNARPQRMRPTSRRTAMPSMPTKEAVAATNTDYRWRPWNPMQQQLR